jgi:GGDEF domain-containing protein
MSSPAGGAEEFIVALPDITAEQAAHILDRVVQRPGGPDVLDRAHHLDPRRGTDRDPHPCR